MADLNKLMALSNKPSLVFLLPSMVLNVFKCLFEVGSDTVLQRLLLEEERITCRKCWRRQICALATPGKRPRGLPSQLCFNCWLPHGWVQTDPLSISAWISSRDKGKCAGLAGIKPQSTVFLHMISTIHFLKPSMCFNLGSQFACSLLSVNTSPGIS